MNVTAEKKKNTKANAEQTSAKADPLQMPDTAKTNPNTLKMELIQSE